MGEARYDGEEPIIGILLDAAGRIPDSALPEIWALLTPGAREPLIRVSKGERMALVDTAGAAERARVIAAVRGVLAELTQRAEDWSYHPDLRTGWATAAQRVAIKLDSLERGEAEEAE